MYMINWNCVIAVCISSTDKASSLQKVETKHSLKVRTIVGHHLIHCIATLSLGLTLPTLRWFCHLRSLIWYDMWYDIARLVIIFKHRQKHVAKANQSTTGRTLSKLDKLRSGLRKNYRYDKCLVFTYLLIQLIDYNFDNLHWLIHSKNNWNLQPYSILSRDHNGLTAAFSSCHFCREAISRMEGFFSRIRSVIRST